MLVIEPLASLRIKSMIIFSIISMKSAEFSIGAHSLDLKVFLTKTKIYIKTIHITKIMSRKESKNVAGILSFYPVNNFVTSLIGAIIDTTTLTFKMSSNSV